MEEMIAPPTRGRGRGEGKRSEALPLTRKREVTDFSPPTRGEGQGEGKRAKRPSPASGR